MVNPIKHTVISTNSSQPLSKIEEEGKLLSSFYEASIMIPKTDKNITRKGNSRPVSFMSIDF